MSVATVASSRNPLEGLVRARPPQAPPGPSSGESYTGARAIQDDVRNALQRLMAGAPSTSDQFADSYGRVKNLALMLSDYVEGEARDQVLNAYKTLFLRMEPDTKFTIVCERDQDRADLQKVITDNKVPNPERIQILQPGIDSLTVWARDMMVPKWDPGDPDHTTLMAQQPLHNWHLSDSQVPGFITAANPSIQLDPEPALVTDGGDVQSNTKEAFVGYYSLSATENELLQGLEGSPFKEDVVHWYENKTGKSVVETPAVSTLPFRFVPVTAPDGTKVTQMQVNPDFQVPQLANGQVSEAQMLDDVSVQLFQQDLGKPVTIMGRDKGHGEEPATDHMDMGMTPIDDSTFLVGDPRLANSVLKGGSRNRDNTRDFDAYASTLQDKGYTVVRVPHHEPSDSGAPYVSYNNCLMERFQKDGTEIRRVFLPVYGLPTDDIAIKTWQSQNFEVIPIPLDKLSAEWGALRCISNWLDRSPKG